MVAHLFDGSDGEDGVNLYGQDDEPPLADPLGEAEEDEEDEGEPSWRIVRFFMQLRGSSGFDGLVFPRCFQTAPFQFCNFTFCTSSN